MQRDYEFETVFSISAGVNLAGDFDKIIDLMGFVMNEEPTMGVLAHYKEVEGHINNLYPEFSSVGDVKKLGLMNWINQKKTEMGATLPVSRLNEPVLKLKQSNQI